MRPVSILLTATVLSSIALLGAPSAVAVPQLPTACSTQSSQPLVLEQSRERTLVQVSANQAVEMLVGQLARNYVGSFSAEKAERLDPRDSELKRRGFERTDLLVVLRSMKRDPRTGEWVGGPASAQIAPATSGSNSEGEIVFASWDDGDDATWEGTTYTQNYSTGAWSSWESQADIASSQGSTIWEVMTGSGGGSSGGSDDSDILIDLRMQLDGGRPQLASLSPQLAGLPGDDGLFVFAQSNPSWSEFLMCSLVNCYGCYKVCRLTGPVFWFCMDPCCMTLMLSCAMLQLV